MLSNTGKLYSKNWTPRSPKVLDVHLWTICFCLGGLVAPGKLQVFGDQNLKFWASDCNFFVKK